MHFDFNQGGIEDDILLLLQFANGNYASRFQQRDGNLQRLTDSAARANATQIAPHMQLSSEQINRIIQNRLANFRKEQIGCDECKNVGLLENFYLRHNIDCCPLLKIICSICGIIKSKCMYLSLAAPGFWFGGGNGQSRGNGSEGAPAEGSRGLQPMPLYRSRALCVVWGENPENFQNLPNF